MKVLAVSGVKNSGKTTLICGLIRCLGKSGLKVATIKHDGHDFDADVPGTDTWKHLSSGAYGTAVFSKNKFMVVKQIPEPSEQELMEFFPEADLLLLEGFKYSSYPKIELIRRGNSTRLVSDPDTLIGIASDFDREKLTGMNTVISDKKIPVWNLNDLENMAAYILIWMTKSSAQE